MAVVYYQKSIEMLEKNWEKFHNIMMDNKDTLLANGIDKDDFRLMLDELQYRV
jgi:hypothetical protein